MPTELEVAATRVNLCLGAERRLLASNAQRRRLPVTIVTGFLGAGKTSLLQHILSHKLNLRVACAVSDLAAINVDALLVANQLSGNGNQLFQLKAEPGASLEAFKDAVWQVLNEDEDAMGLPTGQVDYLVMETSGTTDPTQLVAAVQEKFGKMTRARLDSVVTVVDGDAVAQDAATGVDPNAVAIRQLRCADVVLINKVDLLDATQLETARQVVKTYAPRARVFETDHCQVYLPNVLDIAPPEDVINGVVSHENMRAQWNTGLSALNGAVTPAPSHLRVDRSSEKLSTDASSSSAAPMFSSVAYEKTEPTPLAAVHDWIQHHLPRGTLRAKGVVYVSELPKYRFVVQLSGKRRLEVENTGVWQSTPKTQFVVIGTTNNPSSSECFNEVQTLASLEACFKPTVDHLIREGESSGESSLKKLEADERFETLVSSERPTTVAFRLVCPTSTLDETMLRHHHHVDMNDLTMRLVREVNASGGGSLLLYAANLGEGDGDDGDKMYAVASAVGPASALSIWHELDSRAYIILNEVKHKLAGCLCGF